MRELVLLDSLHNDALSEEFAGKVMVKGKELFSQLAEDYARYRPSYPQGVLDELVRGCGLTPDWVIGDIGSGTGNPAKLFLENGNKVFGVEPNREMRKFCERFLAEYPNFHILDGAAEDIPVESGSVDLITVGQAFHWFNVDSALTEFRRIIRSGGWIAVMWNDRHNDSTPFSTAYVELTEYCRSAYPSPANNPVSFSKDLEKVFAPGTRKIASFPHTKSFDLEGLLGRARSSGYLPQPGAPGYEELSGLMTDLFNRHQSSGRVEFHHTAQLHYGVLNA